jgi:uncharacterized protein (TIGR03067 family)
MYRVRICALWIATVVVLVLHSDGARAEPGDELVGTWEGTANGMQEIWTIARDKKGAFSVTGLFQSNGKEVGSFKGGNVTLDKGILTFRQEYIMKPRANWTDGNEMTARADGDKLNITWKAGKQSGKNVLTRQGAAIAKGPTPKDPGVKEPAPKDPVGKEPPMKNPVGKEPGTKDPATKDPAPKDPVGKEPAPKDPVTKGPAKKDPPASTKKEVIKPTEAALKEMTKLDGKWKFNKIVLDGKTIDFGSEWQFKGEKVVELFGGLQRRAGVIRLDPEKSPKEIDVNFNDGKGGGMTGKFLGVYELDGDKLTICLGTDGNRPSELESKPDSKSMQIVFQRTK